MGVYFLYTQYIVDFNALFTTLQSLLLFVIVRICYRMKRVV